MAADLRLFLADLLSRDMTLHARTLAIWTALALIMMSALVLWVIALRSRNKELRYTVSQLQRPYLTQSHKDRPVLKLGWFQEFLNTVRNASKDSPDVVLAATRALQVILVKTGVVHTVLIEAQERIGRFENLIDHARLEYELVLKRANELRGQSTAYAERIDRLIEVDTRLRNFRKGRDGAALAMRAWRQEDYKQHHAPDTVQ